MKNLVTLIWRFPQLSTGDISRDSSLMGYVSQALRGQGVGVYEMREDQKLPQADVYVSMARSGKMLSELEARERSGALVINATSAVRLCLNRRELERRLREGGVDVPGEYNGEGPCWLKFNSMAGHVTFAHNADGLEQLKLSLRHHGICDWVVSPHVIGRHVKFYGVAGTDFFQAYCISPDSLRKQAEEAARLTGITVYGGDAIVREDGSSCIVDFNDWPSFSPCMEEAAEVIAECIVKRMSEK